MIRYQFFSFEEGEWPEDVTLGLQGRNCDQLAEARRNHRMPHF